MTQPNFFDPLEKQNNHRGRPPGTVLGGHWVVQTGFCPARTVPYGLEGEDKFINDGKSGTVLDTYPLSQRGKYEKIRNLYTYTILH